MVSSLSVQVSVFCLFGSFPPLPLSLVRSLSSPLRYISLFIENKTEQVRLLLVRLQSRNGWSAIDVFGGGGGEEKEAGRF